MFSRAHGDPRAEEAGSGVPEEVRPVLAALPVPRRRAAGRADARWIAEALGGRSIDNYWQTETGWPILSAHAGRRGDAEQVRQPVVPGRTATT